MGWPIPTVRHLRGSKSTNTTKHKSNVSTVSSDNFIPFYIICFWKQPLAADVLLLAIFGLHWSNPAVRHLRGSQVLPDKKTRWLPLRRDSSLFEFVRRAAGHFEIRLTQPNCAQTSWFGIRGTPPNLVSSPSGDTRFLLKFHIECLGISTRLAQRKCAPTSRSKTRTTTETSR